MKINAQLLRPLLHRELMKRGTQDEAARHVAASLASTSLRGTESHGINLFPHYCRAVSAGRVNATPAMVFSQTAPGTGSLDADHGFGHAAGAVAMQHAIAMAKVNGISAVSVRNSTHFGAAAYFGLMAPSQGCLGFAFTNADALVKAHNAREAFCGTNPICFTAPLEREEPLCLDMATSTASWNKINIYRRDNQAIPAHWASNENGEAVTDPHLARSLKPIGEYKGFGLGIMVEVLCSLLAGSRISKDIRAMYAPPLDANKRCISHFFMAVDIIRFVELDLFTQSAQDMVDRIRAMQTLPDAPAVMAPGDPEKLTFQQRTRDGIPMDESRFAEFLEISKDFSSAIIPP